MFYIRFIDEKLFDRFPLKSFGPFSVLAPITVITALDFMVIGKTMSLIFLYKKVLQVCEACLSSILVFATVKIDMNV